jgi:ElaB/YqjD/DUF883 family membrane-anchored ribosome-binding protein
MAALENTRQALGDSLDRTNRHARRIARHSRHAAEDIGSELRELLSELEDTLADGASADATILKKRLRERIDTARERLGDTHAVMRRRAQAVWSDADEYVHERPWQTLAVVAGIALVAGVVLGVRR